MARFHEPVVIRNVTAEVSDEWESITELNVRLNMNRNTLRNYLEYLTKKGKVEKKHRGQTRNIIWRRSPMAREQNLHMQV